MNEKIIDRIKKLLALAADGGATEAEASLAAAKAAEIMEEHGLTTMAVEMAGGVGETRASGQLDTGHESWHERLMSSVAESCFCYSDMKRTGKRSFSFRLIGRQSAVTTASMTFEYLRKAIWRLSREAGVDSPHYFRCGCAERITERLHDRHESKLREQREEAEAKARQWAATGSGGTSLVVTLVDHAQREADLNHDFRRGLKPGTTEERRRKQEREEESRRVELHALMASGIDEGVAWNMVYLNQTREKAEEYEREYLKKQERASKRSSSWTNSDERRWRSQQRREDKRSSGSWTSGRVAGDKVGLETQVEDKRARRIT